MSADPVVIAGIAAETPGGPGPEGLWRDSARRHTPAPSTYQPDKRKLLGRVVDAALADALVEPGDVGADRLVIIACEQANTDDRTLPPFLRGGAADHVRTAVGTARTMALSHACATGGLAIQVASRLLAAREADVVVVAGGSVPDPAEELSLEAVGVLSEAVRPLDVNRSGIAVGRGAAAVVLRRAVDTTGTSGHRAVQVTSASRVLPSRAESNPKAVRSVMEAVLPLSGTSMPPTVDAVCAHATGTPAGDAVEIEALALVAEARNWEDVPVFSNKGAIGHLLHTSALASVVQGVLALERRIVPGTPGCTEPMDAGPRLRVNTEPVETDLRRILINSFGFGGSYAAVLLERLNTREPA